MARAHRPRAQCVALSTSGTGVARCGALTQARVLPLCATHAGQLRHGKLVRHWAHGITIQSSAGVRTGGTPVLPSTPPSGPELGPRTGVVIADLVAPLRLVSTANAREHWRAKSERVRRERQIVAYSLLPRLGELRAAGAVAFAGGQLSVELTRLYESPCRDFDGDNLVASLKAVRDEIAATLGVDDGRGDLVVYETPKQTRSSLTGVRIVVRERV